MSRITWKKEYEIGVPAIDQQHKQLFALLDNLTKPDQDVRMVDLAKQLSRYIDEHLAFEEGLMRKHSYGRMADHIAQHNILRTHYRSMSSKVQAEDPQAVARNRMVIFDWFSHHILGDKMDRDLGLFLQRIGMFLR